MRGKLACVKKSHDGVLYGGFDGWRDSVISTNPSIYYPPSVRTTALPAHSITTYSLAEVDVCDVIMNNASDISNYQKAQELNKEHPLFDF